MNADQMPVVLSREEALRHASEILRQMSAGYEMAKLVHEFGKDVDLPAIDGKTRDTMRDLIARVPEPAIQAASCKAAADTIDALLLEERIIAARMKADPRGEAANVRSAS